MRRLPLFSVVGLVFGSLPSVALADDAVVAGPKSPELTTLRLLHGKGLVSDEELRGAERDLAASAPVADAPTVVLGRWALTLYGFAETDMIYDSTQALTEVPGNAKIPLDSKYAGAHGRFQMSLRNSRFGVRVKVPEWNHVRTSGMLETDFYGAQPAIDAGTGAGETAFYTSPPLRLRHAMLKVDTPVVDVLVGQYWHLFGWQGSYFPNSVQIPGLPGMLFGRTPQLRVSKTLRAGRFFAEVAVAAVRPVQRESGAPEGEGGVRIGFDGWKGAQTVGVVGTTLQPLSVAITGNIRSIAAPAYDALSYSADGKTYTHKVPDETKQQRVYGGGVAVDAFIPLIPAKEGALSNSLSLNGELVKGKGIADQYTGMTGGITQFAVQPKAEFTAPMSPALDTGIAMIDPSGVLHAIGWTSYLVGAQYYLPGANGKAWVAGNFSQNWSNGALDGYVNPAELPAAPSATAPKPTVLGKGALRDRETFWDVVVGGEVFKGVRLAGEYAQFKDTFRDGTSATNHRGQMSAYLVF